MLRLLPLLYLLITYGNTQAVPNFQPYSLQHPEVEFHQTDINIENLDIDLSFIDNAHLNILPDGFIYRLSISFRELRFSAITLVEFADWLIRKTIFCSSGFLPTKVASCLIKLIGSINFEGSRESADC